MTGAPVILRNVKFAYEAMEFCFNSEIKGGEIVAVMGPSGSGKSTFLNLLAGFEVPDRGSILIDGRDVATLPPHLRPVTIVFQENNLFGHLDIASNVGLGRSPSLRLVKSDHERVTAALEKTGLGDKTHRLPSELSGGERQRAAIARALVRDRPVLLLDEPFASLGPALRHEMLDLVRELHTEIGMTIVMVSHHPGDAKSFAERMLFVDDGRIVADGPVAKLLGANPPVPIASYLGTRE